jgi:hypothetical protein
MSTDPRMPFGARPIVDGFESIARARGLRKARVADKMNALGEYVIALFGKTFRRLARLLRHRNPLSQGSM